MEIGKINSVKTSTQQASFRSEEPSTKQEKPKGNTGAVLLTLAALGSAGVATVALVKNNKLKQALETAEQAGAKISDEAKKLVEEKNALTSELDKVKRQRQKFNALKNKKAERNLAQEIRPYKNTSTIADADEIVKKHAAVKKAGQSANHKTQKEQLENMFNSNESVMTRDDFLEKLAKDEENKQGAIKQANASLHYKGKLGD